MSTALPPYSRASKSTMFQMAQQFTENPRSNHDRFQVTRLRCLSNIKLRTESARAEPRLRQLLAHISLYDNVREAFLNPSQDIADLKPIQEEQETDDVQYDPYQQQQQNVPSFRDFQAAIKLQLATIKQVRSTASQITVEEYDSEDDDASSVSSYDSYDGDEFSDDENDTAASQGSLTDEEIMDAECGSPISECSFEYGDDDDEMFVLSPLTPLMATSVHF